ncbi:hypothetical protein ONZ45_g15316 [Pleurotus djamor]|nr:hypothetical protein ONZ45_g15316 [Pleurotus djamor]
MHSTINHLPNDVLSLIFIEYKASFFPSIDYDDNAAEWVNILGICSHWRNVIMKSPRFWSFISISWKELPVLSAMIQRSKAVPLTVHVSDPYYDHLLPSVTELMLQSSRFKYLHLSCTGINGFYSFKKFVKTLDLYPFPSLHSLKLELEEDKEALLHGAIHGQDHQALNLGQSLPWANMSSLRVLDLSDVLIPPDVPPLPLLTELHVDCMFSEGVSVSLTLDWVSTFLHRTPNLTDLSLGELSPYDERTITTPLSKISLPKLKTISVHGADISTIKLFDFLELPFEPMRKVSFSCSSDPDRELDMVDIMGTLKALCARVASVHREHGLPISKVSLIEGLQLDYGLRLHS